VFLTQNVQKMNYLLGEVVRHMKLKEERMLTLQDTSCVWKHLCLVTWANRLS